MFQDGVAVTIINKIYRTSADEEWINLITFRLLMVALEGELTSHLLQLHPSSSPYTKNCYCPSNINIKYFY